MRRRSSLIHRAFVPCRSRANVASLVLRKRRPPCKSLVLVALMLALTFFLFNLTLQSLRLVGSSTTILQSQNISTGRSDVTIVSEFFWPHEHKRPGSHYDEWLPRWFKLPQPKILYTDVPNLMRGLACAASDDVAIVYVDPLKLEVAHRYGFKGSALVYNAKFEVFKMATAWNPYNTTYFWWYDAGLLRLERFNREAWPNFPSMARVAALPRFTFAEIKVINVEEICKAETIDEARSLVDPSDTAAGVMGGTKDYVERFSTAFLETLELSYRSALNSSLTETQINLSSEQLTMAITAFRYPELAHVVRTTNVANIGSPWSFLLNYFDGKFAFEDATTNKAMLTCGREPAFNKTDADTRLAL